SILLNLRSNIHKSKKLIVKQAVLSFLMLCIGNCVVMAQSDPVLVFPDTLGWNHLQDNQRIAFQLKTSPAVDAKFSIDGTAGLDIRFDTLGNFSWTPSYDLVDRVEKTKDFTLIFEAMWGEGKRERKSITFTVKHVNRPPVVEELPI